MPWGDLRRAAVTQPVYFQGREPERIVYMFFFLCHIYLLVTTDELHLTVSFFFFFGIAPVFGSLLHSASLRSIYLSPQNKSFVIFVVPVTSWIAAAIHLHARAHRAFLSADSVRHTKKDRQGPFHFGPRRSFDSLADRDGKSRFCRWVQGGSLCPAAFPAGSIVFQAAFLITGSFSGSDNQKIRPDPGRVLPAAGWRAGHPDGCAPCRGKHAHRGR